MKQRVTIASLSREIVTEADAYRHLETLRWGDTPECAHCGSTTVRLIPPANGISRKTASGSMSERRVWKCSECRKQFSVITGTMMHATKVPVRTWLLVIFDMISAKNGIAAREVERKYGVAPRTAWHMLHRIRQAMSNQKSLIYSMTGTIVADETYIGGKPANRHGHKRGVGGQGVSDKTPVLSLVNEVTGEVRSKVMVSVTGATIRKFMAENVNMAGSRLWTDEGSWYIALGQEFAVHQSVNHSAGQYVRNSASTNMAEGYFAQFKRSLDGTHHHVTVKHLHRYLGEFDFRYYTCKMSDYGRMRTVIGQMEGRLSYKRVTAA